MIINKAREQFLMIVRSTWCIIRVSFILVVLGAYAQTAFHSGPTGRSTNVVYPEALLTYGTTSFILLFSNMSK